MYEVNNNKVFWNQEAIFVAPGRIIDHIKYAGNLIVHYKVANEDKPRFSEEEIFRNVLCLAFNGEVLWKLPLPEKNILPAFRPSYIDVGIGNDGSFWTSDGAYGIRFDPNSGKVIEREFTK